MDLGEQLAKQLIHKMAECSDRDRLQLLETVDNLHVAMFVSWAMMEREDHKDHPPKECGFGTMENLSNRYIEQFAESISMSIKATCEANGISYGPEEEDLNTRTRNAILKEISDCDG